MCPLVILPFLIGADALQVLSDVEGVRIVRFNNKDIVRKDIARHPLVQRIVEAYGAKPQNQHSPKNLVQSDLGNIKPKSGI